MLQPRSKSLSGKNQIVRNIGSNKLLREELLCHTYVCSSSLASLCSSRICCVQRGLFNIQRSHSWYRNTQVLPLLLLKCVVVNDQDCFPDLHTTFFPSISRQKVIRCYLQHLAQNKKPYPDIVLISMQILFFCSINLIFIEFYSQIIQNHNKVSSLQIILRFLFQKKLISTAQLILSIHFHSPHAMCCFSHILRVFIYVYLVFIISFRLLA